MDRVTASCSWPEIRPHGHWATEVSWIRIPTNTVALRSVHSIRRRQNGEDTNTDRRLPAALGTKDQQPAGSSRRPSFLCADQPRLHDYEPFPGKLHRGQPYVGATLSMYRRRTATAHGQFLAWDNKEGKIKWSLPEPFSVWSGALATAGDVVFYGTLEGYLKAVDAATGKELYRFKTPSGVIGNVMTYAREGKQYVAVLSGVGGWAGIGLAAGLTNPTEGLGAVGGYSALSNYTALGGTLTVFKLPE